MNLVELPKVSQTRPQSAVSEPTRLSVPFDPMSRAVDKPLAHWMGEGSRVRVVTGRNLRLVVRQVLVERRARGHAALVQLATA